MAAAAAALLSSSLLLPPSKSYSPPPTFPPFFRRPFPFPSLSLSRSRLSFPPLPPAFHLSPHAPRRPELLLCRAAEYKFPDSIPEFATAETNKFKAHMLARLTKKKKYFGGSVGEVVDVCTEIIFHTRKKRLGSALCSNWNSGDLWEDPDDGNDSESEDMEDEAEEEEEFSGEEGELQGSVPFGDNKSAMSQYEELVKEVELLLEPEEKVILQTSEVPVLSKISTMKWNPFHSLALSGQIRLMDELIELGTDVDCLDKDGFTALHKAVIGKKEAVISHLLRKGANPHARDRDGATPLHHAVQVGAMQTVKLLIKYKVEVNVADNEGWTPLHVAMQTRSRDIAKVLLVNGADKTRRNKDGKTPLDLSLCYGKDFKSYELAKLLKLVPAN
ncbi:ankyrin repeat domain-containing protein, chloroplastic [Canna indica]|uniref:Ankyrin repeat domain-containing protein, chloroplastic n=1 Tax=Canna indica TaxID=4628 RepID=A0AAQ3KS43_9LILI|nr:ankyrin repeat domain-containing protein, chloroplastic [Canna indica]